MGAPELAAAILADSPQGYWKLNETTGTVATDSSGHARNGTYTNGPLLNQSAGLFNAPLFDGVNDHVTIPDASQVFAGTTITVEAWFRTTSNTISSIFAKFNQAATNTKWDLRHAVVAHKSCIYLDRVSGWCEVDTATATDDNAWHQIAGTYNSTTATCQLYLDGAFVASGGFNGGGAVDCDTQGTQAVKVASYDGTFEFFSGYVAHCAFFSSVLSGARILAHYNAALPNVVVAPAVISGVGTVQVPLKEVVRPTPSFVTGVGAVQSPSLAIVALDRLAAYQGQGSSLGIGLAQSTTTSLTGFSKIAEVLLPTTGWEAHQVLDPCLVSDGSGTFRMYYTGWDGAVVLPDYQGSTFKIGLATSVNGGTTWTRHASNPLVSVGGAGTWDHINVRYPYVMYDASDADATRRWKMWYCGSGPTNTGDYQIGYAYSSDGITWTKAASNPKISRGSYFALHGIAVLKSAGIYYLYYSRVTRPWAEGATLRTEICVSTFTNPEGTYTDGTNPLITVADPETKTFTALTSTVNIGDTALHVANTASFTVGDNIYIRRSDFTGDRGFAAATITSIPSSTTINFTPAVVRQFPVDNAQGFASFVNTLWVGYVIPRSVRQVGTDWMIFGTLGGQFYFQQDTGATYQSSTPYGRAVAFKSALLASGWAPDKVRGLLLPLGDATSVWTDASGGWDQSEADALVVSLSTVVDPPPISSAGFNHLRIKCPPIHQ